MKHGAINVVEKYNIFYNTSPGETTPTLYFYILLLISILNINILLLILILYFYILLLISILYFYKYFIFFILKFIL